MACNTGIHIPSSFHLSNMRLTYSSVGCQQCPSCCLQPLRCRCNKQSQCRCNSQSQNWRDQCVEKFHCQRCNTPHHQKFSGLFKNKRNITLEVASASVDTDEDVSCACTLPGGNSFDSKNKLECLEEHQKIQGQHKTKKISSEDRKYLKKNTRSSLKPAEKQFRSFSFSTKYPHVSPTMKERSGCSLTLAQDSMAKSLPINKFHLKHDQYSPARNHLSKAQTEEQLEITDTYTSLSSMKTYFNELVNTYRPGSEIKFYKAVIKECRMFLEQSLKNKDRRLVETIYFKALESLFRLNVDKTGSMENEKHYHNSVCKKGSVKAQQEQFEKPCEIVVSTTAEFDDDARSSPKNQPISDAPSLHGLKKGILNENCWREDFQTFRNLRYQAQQLEQERKKLRQDLSFESKSMVERKKLNWCYFNTLDALNNAKLKIQTLKKFITDNYRYLLTNDVQRKLFTEHHSGEDDTPADNQNSSPTTTQNSIGSNKCKQNVHKIDKSGNRPSVPSSFTNITSLDVHTSHSKTNSKWTEDAGISDEQDSEIERKFSHKKIGLLSSHSSQKIYEKKKNVEDQYVEEKDEEDEEDGGGSDTDSFKRNEEYCAKIDEGEKETGDGSDTDSFKRNEECCAKIDEEETRDGSDTDSFERNEEYCDKIDKKEGKTDDGKKKISNRVGLYRREDGDVSAKDRKIDDMKFAPAYPKKNAKLRKCDEGCKIEAIEKLLVQGRYDLQKNKLLASRRIMNWDGEKFGDPTDQDVNGFEKLSDNLEEKIDSGNDTVRLQDDSKSDADVQSMKHRRITNKSYGRDLTDIRTKLKDLHHCNGDSVDEVREPNNTHQSKRSLTSDIYMLRENGKSSPMNLPSSSSQQKGKINTVSDNSNCDHGNTRKDMPEACINEKCTPSEVYLKYNFNQIEPVEKSLHRPTTEYEKSRLKEPSVANEIKSIDCDGAYDSHASANEGHNFDASADESDPRRPTYSHSCVNLKQIPKDSSRKFIKNEAPFYKEKTRVMRGIFPVSENCEQVFLGELELVPLSDQNEEIELSKEEVTPLTDLEDIFCDQYNLPSSNQTLTESFDDPDCITQRQELCNEPEHFERTRIDERKLNDENMKFNSEFKELEQDSEKMRKRTDHLAYSTGENTTMVQGEISRNEYANIVSKRRASFENDIIEGQRHVSGKKLETARFTGVEETNVHHSTETHDEISVGITKQSHFIVSENPDDQISDNSEESIKVQEKVISVNQAMVSLRTSDAEIYSVHQLDCKQESSGMLTDYHKATQTSNDFKIFEDKGINVDRDLCFLLSKLSTSSDARLVKEDEIMFVVNGDEHEIESHCLIVDEKDETARNKFAPHSCPALYNDMKNTSLVNDAKVDVSTQTETFAELSHLFEQENYSSKSEEDGPDATSSLQRFGRKVIEALSRLKEIRDKNKELDGDTDTKHKRMLTPSIPKKHVFTQTHACQGEVDIFSNKHHTLPEGVTQSINQTQNHDEHKLNKRLSGISFDLKDLSNSYKSLLNLAKGIDDNKERKLYHTYLLLNRYSDEMVKKVISTVFMEAKYFIHLLQEEEEEEKYRETFNMFSNDFKIDRKTDDDVEKHFTSLKLHSQRKQTKKKKIILKKRSNVKLGSGLQGVNANVTAAKDCVDARVGKKRPERRHTREHSEVHIRRRKKSKSFDVDKKCFNDKKSNDESSESSQEALYEVAPFPSASLDDFKTATLTVQCNIHAITLEPKGKRRNVGVNDDVTIRQEFDALFGSSDGAVMVNNDESFPTGTESNKNDTLSFDDDFISKASSEPIREGDVPLSEMSDTRKKGLSSLANSCAFINLQPSNTSDEFFMATNEAHITMSIPTFSARDALHDSLGSTESGFGTMESFDVGYHQCDDTFADGKYRHRFGEWNKVHPIVQRNSVIRHGPMETFDYVADEKKSPLLTSGENIKTAKLMKRVSLEEDYYGATDNKISSKSVNIVRITESSVDVTSKTDFGNSAQRQCIRTEKELSLEEDYMEIITLEKVMKKKIDSSENVNISRDIYKGIEEKLNEQDQAKEQNKLVSLNWNEERSFKKLEIMQLPSDNNLNNGCEKINNDALVETTQTELDWTNNSIRISAITSTDNSLSNDDLSLVILSLEKGFSNEYEMELPTDVSKVDGLCPRIDADNISTTSDKNAILGKKRTFVLYDKAEFTDDYEDMSEIFENYLNISEVEMINLCDAESSKNISEVTLHHKEEKNIVEEYCLESSENTSLVHKHMPKSTERGHMSHDIEECKLIPHTIDIDFYGSKVAVENIFADRGNGKLSTISPEILHNNNVDTSLPHIEYQNISTFSTTNNEEIKKELNGINSDNNSTTDIEKIDGDIYDDATISHCVIRFADSISSNTSETNISLEDTLHVDSNVIAVPTEQKHQTIEYSDEGKFSATDNEEVYLFASDIDDVEEVYVFASDIDDVEDIDDVDDVDGVEDVEDVDGVEDVDDVDGVNNDMYNDRNITLYSTRTSKTHSNLSENNLSHTGIVDNDFIKDLTKQNQMTKESHEMKETPLDNDKTSTDEETSVPDFLQRCERKKLSSDLGEGLVLKRKFGNSDAFRKISMVIDIADQMSSLDVTPSLEDEDGKFRSDNENYVGAAIIVCGHTNQIKNDLDLLQPMMDTTYGDEDDEMSTNSKIAQCHFDESKEYPGIEKEWTMKSTIEEDVKNSHSSDKCITCEDVVEDEQCKTAQSDNDQLEMKVLKSTSNDGTKMEENGSDGDERNVFDPSSDSESEKETEDLRNSFSDATISKEILILTKMNLKKTCTNKSSTEKTQFNQVISHTNDTMRGASYQHTPYPLYTKVSDDYDATIIIDNGSGSIKAGLSTDNVPTVTPSIVGTPNYQKVFPTENEQDCWFGWEANKLRGILKLKYPIQDGVVEDWEGMEKLWNHVFNSILRLEPSEYPVFMTEPPCNSKKNRERMLEIMMETYDVPGYYVGVQAVMSLYSAGRTTGIVLDSGESVTNAVPVYEGYGLPHAVKRMNIGGRQMTNHLRRILSEKGVPFATSAEFEICREIKETQCFVATDTDMFNERSFSSFAKEYELPDGEIITLDSERIRCPEILFRPALIGEDLPGAHNLIYQSVQAVDVDLRTELFRNIILSGGSTLFPGLQERLKNELIICSSGNKNIIQIHSTKERKFSVFDGASILSSLSTFQDMLISSEDYFEVGKSIVHVKCFQ